jgi:hypothetical protein
MKKLLVFSECVALFCMIFLLPQESGAVPSYARQVQKPCTACHTIWPNLNQAGRQFKVKAYTDVHQDWQMLNKDNLNLLQIFPVSARAIFLPYTHEMDKVAGINENTTELDQVAVFVASRVFDYAGVFASLEWSHDDGNVHLPTAKLAFQYPIAEGNTLGLVAFKGLATSADPFNSLGGRDRTLSFGDESIPWILTKGWTFSFWSEENLGVVAHGYFLGNRLYAAIGAERGGDSADAGFGFSNNKNSDPFDGYFRLAWDQKLSNGAVTFGGAWYTGKQRPTSNSTPLFKSSIDRGYLDASLEQNFGEDHLVEVQALYGYGKEKNVFGGDETRKFDGFLVEGSYFFKRTIGLVGAYNKINIKNVLDTDVTNPVTTPPAPGTDENKKNTWLIGLNYLPWLNTKVSVQYAVTKTKFVGGQPDENDKRFKVVFDIVF